MPHAVEEKVRAVSRRVRRFQAVFGMAVAAAIVLAVALAVGLADYLLRFEDPGLRFLASCVVLTTLAWVAWRYAIPGCTYRPTDLHVAQQIEQHFPELENRLGSTIEFLRQSEDDPAAGSPDLRRAVVAHTAGEVERLDFAPCLDRRRPRWAGIAATAVFLLAGTVCWLDTSGSSLAARRLLRPWSGEHWPRRHRLAFVDCLPRIALGADFEATVVDRNGRLPESVEIHYWFDGDGTRDIQVKEMKLLGDKMVHRLENVRRSFRYRATGGDDRSMDWSRRVEVVEPPRVESLTLRLLPPAYTGWPEEPAEENIQALAGTRVAVTGTLTKPAAAVVWKTDNRELPDVPVALSADGLEFSIAPDAPSPWIVRTSASYWFEVIDADGVSGGAEARWTIRVLRDAPPTVSLEKPGANTFVTADAVVPLEGTVRDDLRVRSVAVRYRRSDDVPDPAPPANGDSPGAGPPPAAPAQRPQPAAKQEQSLCLFAGPETSPRVTAAERKSVAERGDSVPVRYAWDLSQLSGLTPGTWIDFSVVAEDYQPQTGQCTPRRLTIITVDELEDRIAARQAFILGQLAEVLRVQRDARSQTRALAIQCEQTGRLSGSDLDQLQSAELNERQVAKLLSDPADGVQSQIAAVLNELTSNRMDRPEVARRMTELQQAVDRIERELVPAIQAGLLNALKVARAAAPATSPANATEKRPPDAALADALRGAGQRQDEVIEVLERLLGELTQWDSYRRFAREIARVRQAQEDIQRETEQVRLDTLGRDWQQLTPQQKASLSRLAERQQELARQFDKVQARMDKMRGELREADPLAAQTLSDALDVAHHDAIGGQMRESGRHIAANRVGQSGELQQQVIRSLGDLLDRLAGRREHELDRRQRMLDEAEATLQQLQRKEQQLLEKLQQAAGQKDQAERKRQLQQLTREQQQLAEETQRLARQLQRLQAERPAGRLDEAAAAMQRSAEAAAQGECSKAQEQSRLAQQSLEQAQQELAQTRRQTQQDLFQEQMVRLQQELQGLTARQQSTLDATRELETLRTQQSGRFTRAQLASIEDLAKRQRDLAADAGTLSQRVARAPVFVLGLQGATREMDRAGKGLDQRETGTATQQAQTNALARLQQLIAALQRPPPTPSEKPPGGSKPDGPSPNPSAGDGIQRLAELKLLKSLQEQVNRRTAELDAARVRQATLTPPQLEELAELAREQGRLADLITDLSRPADEKPEENPEMLPDVREDQKKDEGVK
jgi:hypothetical protein